MKLAHLPPLPLCVWLLQSRENQRRVGVLSAGAIITTTTTTTSTATATCQPFRNSKGHLIVWDDPIVPGSQGTLECLRGLQPNHGIATFFCQKDGSWLSLFGSYSPDCGRNVSHSCMLIKTIAWHILLKKCCYAMLQDLQLYLQLASMQN